jgi:hypothetical protein
MGKIKGFFAANSVVINGSNCPILAKANLAHDLRALSASSNLDFLPFANQDISVSGCEL